MVKPLLKDLVGKRVRLNRSITRRDNRVIVEGTTGTIDGVWRGKFTIIQYATAGKHGRGWVTLLRQVPRNAFDLL